MNTVIKFPGAAEPASKPVSRGSNVDENARTGFRLFYRSMKSAAWYRDLAKKSVMFHLILEVAHEQRTVQFAGKRIQLTRGQLVCSARSLGQECGISEDQARRALEYFREDGAISCVGARGKHGYTIVTLLNFDAYQRGLSQIFSAEYGADSEAAPEQVFGGDHQISGADLPAELHAEDYNNNNNIKDNTEGASACADTPTTAGKTKSPNTPYQTIVDIYHEVLPEMPGVRELTDGRRTKIRNFWSKFKFTEQRWRSYLTHIATHCRWMCESRPRRDGESQWKPKNLDFLITEKCYLGVREGRFNDE
ncbi:hypothetical protein SAMN05880558_1133 [Aeromonas sp. RU39B]|uniref:hypothetical protein n=1 Tax=Aeromonas sp. RU39B TaxID=1907416 RepID=UPI000954F26B|nr:hypothetical protein [Aeromonas sp. RU39B]SIR39291.1 hypothetical protein SAMN05880558_1133 [Aeromonas sp. RU39B]